MPHNKNKHQTFHFYSTSPNLLGYWSIKYQTLTDINSQSLKARTNMMFTNVFPLQLKPPNRNELKHPCPLQRRRVSKISMLDSHSHTDVRPESHSLDKSWILFFSHLSSLHMPFFVKSFAIMAYQITGIFFFLLKIFPIYLYLFLFKFYLSVYGYQDWNNGTGWNQPG